MGCSTGTDPINNSVTLGSVAKFRESGKKTTKKPAKMLDQLQLPDRMWHIPPCLDQVPDLIWGRDHFLQDKTGNYHDTLNRHAIASPDKLW